MNENQLLDVCDTFGLRSGPAYEGSKWGPHMSISCPLSPIKHNDPVDYNLSCSVSIGEDEPSLARCFSFNCGFKGALFRALELAAGHRGNPESLVAVLKALEPTEKFTTDAAFARSDKRNTATIDRMRRVHLPEKEQDLLPEGRLTRFRSGIPRYALSRGLSKETCNEWELGYDKRLRRLVFPIRRYDGKLVGLSGRILPGAAERAESAGQPVAKYHNYAGLDKTRYLFGEHRLKQKSPIIICEGQIDAILTWQALGIPCVGILGEGFSSDHVRTLCAFEPPVVYLFPDNDPPGRLGAEKIEYAIHGRIPMKLMLPPIDMDPGDLTEDEIRAAFSAATVIGHRIEWS